MHCIPCLSRSRDKDLTFQESQLRNHPMMAPKVILTSIPAARCRQRWRWMRRRRMLHDKVDFHIRRRVRWVPSDASTSIDEFEICARGRSQPDAGDIVVPYAVIDILILLLTQVFHSYTPHGCCPKDYAYSIQRPSHHQIAQGRCRLTLCLTTREEIILA